MRSEGLWENLLPSMLPFSNFRYNCLLHNRSLFRHATGLPTKSRKGHLEIFSRPQDIENYRFLVIFASPNRYFKENSCWVPPDDPLLNIIFDRRNTPFISPAPYPRLIVCWTTVLSLVTQRTSPQRGALRDETKETTAVFRCGRCPDMQHILSETWDQEKKPRWRKMAPESCHVYSDIMDYMVILPFVFNFSYMA